jgi:hypothetical protein
VSQSARIKKEWNIVVVSLLKEVVSEADEPNASTILTALPSVMP